MTQITDEMEQAGAEILNKVLDNWMASELLAEQVYTAMRKLEPDYREKADLSFYEETGEITKEAWKNMWECKWTPDEESRLMAKRLEAIKKVKVKPYEQT